MQYLLSSLQLPVGSKQYTKRKIISFVSMLWLFVCSFNISHAQYDIPEKPSFIPPVIDSTKTLSKQEFKFLYDKLKNYNDTTSTEVALIIIPTTKGENINFLGAQWGEKWKIGQKGKDNGILILLAKDDRKIAISTGYGIEYLLTDALSKRIIERDIIPFFKRNDYYGGLNRGTDAIFEVLQGEYKGSKKSNNDFPVGALLIFLFIFFIILISISKNKRGGGRGGNRGNRTNGTSILDAIILSNMGRSSSSGWGGSSSGGGWSSGGGFGGFGGGGSFGGGGASGGW